MTRLYAVLFALAAAFCACAQAADDTFVDACAEASTAATFVQVAYATPQDSQASTSVSLTNPEAAGDLNVVVLGWNDTTSVVSSVTDTQGNSYRLAVGPTRNAEGGNSQAIYYATNIAAGADRVTATLSAAAWYPDLRVVEYSGVVALDTSAGAAGTSNPSSVGPVTTSTPGDLLVAAGTTQGGFFGPGSGFVQRVITAPDEDLVEDEVAGGAGAYSATAVDDGSPWTFQVAAFSPRPVSDAGADATTDSSADAGTADTSLDAEDGSDGTSDAPSDVAPEVAADGSPVDADDASDEDAAATDASGASDAHGDVASEASTDAAPPVAPMLVQHVASSVNPVGQGEPGNDYRFTLPNPVGAGNTLILALSYGYSASRTVSVTDSAGNAWPASPAVSATDGAAMTSAIYVLPRARSGTTTIAVDFDAPVQPFQYTLSEFAGVGAVDAATSSMAISPNVSAGNLATAAGDLVWAYAADIDTGETHAATNVAAGSGFTLLDADIAWPAQGMPHASEYAVATGASMTPALTVTQSGSNDAFLALAVALRSAQAGTLPDPNAMRVVRINHMTSEGPSTPTWSLQLPSVGNLLVLTTADWPGLLDITSITDTAGNVWTREALDNGTPQIWFAANATPSTNLKLSLHTAGTPAGASVELWDIVGAAASPFDVMTGVDLTNDVGGANLSATPAITPTSSGGLTIAVVGLGQGPSFGLAGGAPPGAIFDFVSYAGETDFDTMDNADCLAHLYNTDMSPESWNWLVDNGSQTTEYSATAVHFNAAR